jgi:hypothetical protein
MRNGIAVVQILAQLYQLGVLDVFKQLALQTLQFDAN